MFKNKVIEFNIITFFPDIYINYLNVSFIKQYQIENKIKFNIYDVKKDIIYDESGKKIPIDGSVYGGGSGMLMRYDFFYFFIKKHNINTDNVFHLAPKGILMNYKNIFHISEKVYKHSVVTIICSRYEGIDQRIIDEWNVLEISIGDYVLFDGDTANFVLINAIVRDLLANPKAKVEESFTLKDNLVEYNQYTYPLSFNNRNVPNVLVSGNHKLIKDWKMQSAINNTNKRNKK
ncbi:tRNA (guanine-N(1)-)-methyltransferase [bacterium AB1]|nr:tRNA (guanine-N(1)-)-methyltransferase [bacterium AB1]